MTQEEARKHLIDWVSYVENPNSIPDFDQPCSADEIIESMKIGAEALSKSELPEGLEEAAKKHIQSVVDTAGHPGWNWETQDVADAFIAGAEYQRKQDQQPIELAEDHAMLAGMNKMKEEMMEKAVGGRYMKAAGSVYVESWPLDIDPDSVKAGDEVKLIIIPEEK